MTDKARLTLDLDPVMHRRLKVLAARRRMSMREICLQAIQRHMVVLENPNAIGPDTVLDELWNNEADAIYDDL